MAFLAQRSTISKLRSRLRSTLWYSTTLDKKRKAALLGGGDKRLQKQHETVKTSKLFIE